MDHHICASTARIPPPFSHTSSTSPQAPTLITQGAEAIVYRTVFLSSSTPCALKYRPPKEYRHPVLDRRLTRARILGEARVLVRCRKEGIKVPAVLALDADAGWLLTEWITGPTVRDFLNEHKDLGAASEELGGLMACIGRAVGRLHEIGVVHGDLTTSNLMLRASTSSSSASSTSAAVQGNDTTDAVPATSPSAAPLQPQWEVVVIDFGLSSQTAQDEDRAVDLYVLERAFGATHPSVEPLFSAVLQAYGESYKAAKVALRRLEDVRARGRKRSLIG